MARPPNTVKVECVTEVDPWILYPFPEWFPMGFVAKLKGSHRSPSAWLEAAAKERCCPELGEVVTLREICGGQESATGRWIYAWGNIGRLVMPDGTMKVVAVPYPQGPRQYRPLVLEGKAAQLEARGESNAVTYRFAAPPCDWMHATICDETATLSIASDCGDYVYRWPNEDRTLTQSIAWDFDEYYIAAKLTTRDTRRRYSADATEKHVYEELLRRRREGDISKKNARILWDGFAFIQWESVDLCVEGLHDLDAECKGDGLFGWEAYEYLQYKPGYRYLHLRDVYLPALRARLQKIPSAPSTPLPTSDPDTREWAWDYDGRVSSSTFLSREDAISDALEHCGPEDAYMVDVGRVEAPPLAHYITAADPEILAAHLEMEIAGDYGTEDPVEVHIEHGAQDAMLEWIQEFVRVVHPAWVIDQSTVEQVRICAPEESGDE